MRNDKSNYDALHTITNSRKEISDQCHIPRSKYTISSFHFITGI